MKANGNILTKEERDTLLLIATHPEDRHLSNIEIAQYLGVSLDRVKTLIRQTCSKLGAHNRTEAIFFALKKGEIKLNEIYSNDELVEIKSSLFPDILGMIIRMVREGQKDWHFPKSDEQTMLPEERQDSLLTKSERDVLVLAGRGLTNKEIADTLYISVNSVRTFLYRAYAKLGVHKRMDAVMLALKQGEINLSNMFSRNELLEALAPMGAEIIEQIALQLGEKPK